jgi:hypothetical protein
MCQVGQAHEKLKVDWARRRTYFQQTGCLMTASGQFDDAIKPQGTETYSFAKEMGDEKRGGDRAPDDEKKAEEKKEEKSDEEEEDDVKEEKKADRPGAGQKKRKKKVESESEGESGSDDELFDDEDDPDQMLQDQPVGSCVPTGYALVDKCPASDADLQSSLIMFRWAEVGWTECFVEQQYKKPKGRHGFTHEISWGDGAKMMDLVFQSRLYGKDEAGGWYLLKIILD